MIGVCLCLTTLSIISDSCSSEAPRSLLFRSEVKLSLYLYIFNYPLLNLQSKPQKYNPESVTKTFFVMQRKIFLEADSVLLTLSKYDIFRWFHSIVQAPTSWQWLIEGTLRPPWRFLEIQGLKSGTLLYLKRVSILKRKHETVTDTTRNKSEMIHCCTTNSYGVPNKIRLHFSWINLDKKWEQLRFLSFLLPARSEDWLYW